ncbi:MAG: hypothetical protein WBF88_17435 [Pusillimonas sp.]
MTLLIAQIWPYLLGFAALVAGYIAARQSGKASERSRQASDRINSIKEAKNVQNKTAGMSDDAVSSELKSKWVRGDKR